MHTSKCPPPSALRGGVTSVRFANQPKKNSFSAKDEVKNKFKSKVKNAELSAACLALCTAMHSAERLRATHEAKAKQDLSPLGLVRL